MPDKQNGTENGIKTRQRVDLRLDLETKAKLEAAARDAGFRNLAAFVRQILSAELKGKRESDQVADMEQKTVATIHRLSRDTNQLRLQLLATYCLVDGLAKVVLTCLPEPSPQMSEQATANAKRRYERLNRAVAQARAENKSLTGFRRVNKTKGQWRAHGRYLERDSAVGENQAFDQTETGVDLQERLAGWQSAGDSRLFKFILSPEFGDRLDLQAMTRDFMRRVEHRVGAPLEWTAVIHNNTEHPHVHVALRGMVAGRPLRLDRDLIRNGLREEAERLCTLTLGYRTDQDILASQRQEVGFSRATSLDRQILKRAVPGGDGELRVEIPASQREFFQLLASRMAVLSRMGLAQPEGEGWNIRADYLQILKTMQQAGDRQKMLHQYGVLLSDPRLPTQVTPRPRHRKSRRPRARPCLRRHDRRAADDS